MGSHKIKTIDAPDMSEEKSKTASKQVTETLAEAAKSEAKAKKAAPKKERSKRYQQIRSQVDKTKTYPLNQAIDLIKKFSQTTAHKTITADINYRDESFSGELKFPHSTGKTIRVAIATEDILAQIEKNQIDFDILLAEPAMMAKVAKYARFLGPRGLMPNPKNNTVTANPQKRKKELEGGKVTVRAERKAPLIHLQVGNTTQPNTEIVENLEALIKFLNPSKIRRLTLSSTMSPGVKIDLATIAA